MRQPQKLSFIRKAQVHIDRLDRGTQNELFSYFLDLIGELGGIAASRNLMEAFRLQPTRLASELEKCAKGSAWAQVVGPVDERLIFVGFDEYTGVAVSLGRPLHLYTKSASFRSLGKNGKYGEYIMYFTLDSEQKHRLNFPRLALIALYHPENFPLPRFALGISDLGRAARKARRGSVELYDMQLGSSLEEIVAEVRSYNPDIIGISATFGQQDLLEACVSQLKKERPKALVLVGGSLAALNAEEILRTGTADAVCVGSGEHAIQRLMERSSFNDADLSTIPDIKYIRDGKIVSTPKFGNRTHDDILPELDLLEETLNRGGVMQLESSRGCSYSCSFCPREHKGVWAGEDAAAIDFLLPEIDELFRKSSKTDRRIFLVDEEFVGYQPDEFALPRCTDFAEKLNSYSFGFETSSRIDQVYRHNRDNAWHLGRMAFWRQLVSLGMRRCLFGVESGVTSILERFNKKTSTLQNVMALRILSALGIPIRCTYITYDPLMSVDELMQTHSFLGRCDIILDSKKMAHLSNSEILDIVHDDELSSQYAVGIPFFHHVSYMLVAMEALIGSKYLSFVEAEGLAGEMNTLMGRREVTYKVKEIGTLADASQRWIDRNFSLDYTLKSFEKIIDGKARKVIREARVILKEAAYNILTQGIQRINEKNTSTFVMNEKYLESAFEPLRKKMFDFFQSSENFLSDEINKKVSDELKKWAQRKDWNLINGACE